MMNTYVDLGHLCGEQYDALVFGERTNSSSATAREKRRARIQASVDQHDDNDQDDGVVMKRTGSRISVVSDEKKSESVDEVILGEDTDDPDDPVVVPVYDRQGTQREGTSFFEGNMGRESTAKVMIQSKDARPLPRPSTMNGRAKRNRTKQLSMPLQQGNTTATNNYTTMSFFQGTEQKSDDDAAAKSSDGFTSMYDTIYQMFCTPNTSQIASVASTDVHVERVPTQDQLSKEQKQPTKSTKDKNGTNFQLLCAPDCGQITSPENSEVHVERLPTQDQLASQQRESTKQIGDDEEATVATFASTPDRSLPVGGAGSPDSAESIPSVEQDVDHTTSGDGKAAATPPKETNASQTKAVKPQKTVASAKVKTSRNSTTKATPVSAKQKASQKGKAPETPAKKKGIRGLFRKKPSTKDKTSPKRAGSAVATTSSIPSKVQSESENKDGDSAEEEDNAEVVAILFPEKDEKTAEQQRSAKQKRPATPATDSAKQKRSATPATETTTKSGSTKAKTTAVAKKSTAAVAKKSTGSVAKKSATATTKAEPLKRSASAPKDSPSRRSWFKKSSPNSSPDRPPSTPTIMQSTFGRPKTPATNSPARSKADSKAAKASDEKSETNTTAEENIDEPANASPEEESNGVTIQQVDVASFEAQPNLIAPPFVQRASVLENPSTSPPTLPKTSSSRRKTPLTRKPSALSSIDEDKAGTVEGSSLPPRTSSLVQDDEEALTAAYKSGKTSSMISEGGESEMTDDPSIMSGDASMYSASVASQDPSLFSHDPSLFSHQTQDMNLAQFGKSILKEMRRPGSFKRDDFILFPKNASIADLLPTKIAEGDNEDAEEEEDDEEDSIEEYGQVWEKP